mgnify:CR=1 FL=1
MIAVMKDEALKLRRLNHEVTLLYGNSKLPRFKNVRSLTDVEIAYWLRRERLNLGLILKGMTCVDVDGDEGMDFVKEHGLAYSPMSVLTRKGVRFYFQGEIKTRIRFLKLPVDLLSGDRRMTVMPPSVVDGFEYRYLNGPARREELPIFPEKILDLEPRREVIQPVVVPSSNEYERALKYATNPKVEVAVSGQGGHSRMIWFACRMLKLFSSLSEEQLMAVLRAFNERCLPPFSDSDLQHKATEAFKLTRGSHG